MSSADESFKRAYALAEDGHEDEAIEAYRALADRFAEDPAERSNVAWARVNSAIALTARERIDEALAALDAAIAMVEGDPLLARQQTSARLQRGQIHARAGSLDQALADFDVIDDGEAAAEARAWTTWVITDAARDIAEARPEEGLVRLGALRARGADPTDGDQVINVVLAALHVVSAFAGRDELGPVAALPELIAEVLGIDDTQLEDPAPGEPDESALAALLADAFDPESWRLFGDDGDDRDRELHAARALGLLRATAPGAAAFADDPELDAPSSGATSLLRGIAGLHAQLSGSGPAEPALVSLVSDRGRFELGARVMGLDAWAADRGYPLPLTAHGGGEPPELDPPDDDPVVSALAVLIIGEVIRVARRAPSADVLLTEDGMGEYPVMLLRTAASVVAAADRAAEDLLGTGIACLLVTESLFTAVHGSGPAEWYPGAALLRTLIDGALDDADGLPARLR